MFFGRESSPRFHVCGGRQMPFSAVWVFHIEFAVGFVYDNRRALCCFQRRIQIVQRQACCLTVQQIRAYAYLLVSPHRGSALDMDASEIAAGMPFFEPFSPFQPRQVYCAVCEPHSDRPAAHRVHGLHCRNIHLCCCCHAVQCGSISVVRAEPKPRKRRRGDFAALFPAAATIRCLSAATPVSMRSLFHLAAHGNSSMPAMASIRSSKGSSVLSVSAAKNFKMLFSGCCFELFRNMRATCCVKLCNRVLGKDFFCCENKKLCYGCRGCSAAVRVCLLVRQQRKRRRIRDDSSRSHRDDGDICGIRNHSDC